MIDDFDVTQNIKLIEKLKCELLMSVSELFCEMNEKHEIDDLVEYIYSLSSMTTLSTVPKKEIHDLLTKQMGDGVLSVPKEYGMFCCRKD